MHGEQRRHLMERSGPLWPLLWIFSILFLLVSFSSAAALEPGIDTLRAMEDRRAAVDDSTPVWNWITIHPLKLLVGVPFTTPGVVHLSYYRVIIPEIVVGVGLSTPTWEKDKGGGIHVDLRYYSSALPRTRGYFAIDASYRDIRSDSPPVYSIGCLAGFQSFSNRHITVNMAYGYDYYIRVKEPPPPGTWRKSPTFVGSMLAFQFEFGYAW